MGIELGHDRLAIGMVDDGLMARWKEVHQMIVENSVVEDVDLN